MRCAMRGAGAVPVGPAGTAAEAIRLAGEEELDGVLLEVRRHESDAGVQVAQYLRTKAVPNVLVTGYDRLARDPRLQHLPYLEQAAVAVGPREAGGCGVRRTAPTGSAEVDAVLSAERHHGFFLSPSCVVGGPCWTCI